jgi:hypothetical protein
MSDAFENLSDWKHEMLRTLRKRIDRRSFLRQSAGALGGLALGGTLLGALASRLDAAGEPPIAGPVTPSEPSSGPSTGTFYFPRLKFDVLAERCNWDCYPDADANLRRQVRRLTNINMSEEAVVCSLDDLDGMVKYPFVFATDERHFKFSKKEEDNLAEYLKRGGFLYGDDCVYENQSLFFRDYRDMMNKIWPDNPMRRVPDDHPLYHCYFDFPKGLPNLQGEFVGSWATFDRKSDRILTLVTPTDMHCGWTCRFFNPELNMAALKMGINIIVYYLSH